MTFIEYLPKNYGRAPQTLLIDGLHQLCRQIPLQPAALILFQWPKTPFPSHAGIYTGENLIHSFQAEGRVIEHALSWAVVNRTPAFSALPGRSMSNVVRRSNRRRHRRRWPILRTRN